MRDVVGFWSGYWPPVAVAIGGLLLGYLVQRVTIPLLARLAARSSWRYDDLLVDAIKWPMVLWFALAGLRVAVRMLPLAPRTDAALGIAMLVIAIISVTWAVSRFAAGLVRGSTLVGAAGKVSLLASVARWTVIVIGLLVALQTVGVRITPVITALGIGGLAVGLALQDTLANFFSGIRILAAQKIRPGDFITLESGQEGWVEDITWGQTTIRQPSNNLVIVPNARLASAITTNYDLPFRIQNFVIQMGVAYGSDLDRVEQVCVAVAREVQRSVPEANPDFEPVLRYKEFGASSVNFFVVMQTRAFTDRWSLISEFIKRIHARFAAEGIEIPFPVQTVMLKGPGAAPRGSA